MRYVALGWSCVLALLSGCGDDDCCAMRDGAVDSPTVPTDANPGLTEVALIPGTINRDVDLLFVIDDSPSMLDKQTNLKSSFPHLIDALASGGTLPNLHIGVISTDMGTQAADSPTAGSSIGSGPGSCLMSGGKDGALQTAGSMLVSGKFIIHDNGTTNYTGTLAEAFQSIASLGANGCGFEQPLAAIRRATMNVENAGFLRATARLAIIVLSDEDDCSASQPTLFGADTTTLGPLQSFRCTRFGVTCDVGGTTSDEMNVVGVKNGCHSNEASPYLTDVGRYATLLAGLKPDPRDVLFSAIVGDTSGVATELRAPPGGGTAIPVLAHVCTYSGATGVEAADPAVRIEHLAGLVRRGSVASVCSPNLQPVLSEMGQRIKSLVGAPCIDRTIAQPATCEVWDEVAGGTEQWVPPCTETSGAPCFTITPDPAICPAAQNLAVLVTRPFPVSADTWTSVRCAL